MTDKKKWRGWGQMRAAGMTDDMMNPENEEVRWVAHRLIKLRYPVTHVEGPEIVMSYSSSGARYNGARRLESRGYHVIHECREDVGIVIFGDEEELKERDAA